MGDGFQLHNGKFLVDPAGFAVHADCCCGFPCATCTGNIPYRIKAVFSGITACPGCRTFPSGRSYQVTGVWNGTILLTNFSDCLWRSDLFDAFTVDIYTAACAAYLRTRTFQARAYCRVDGVNPYVVIMKGFDAADPDETQQLYSYSASLPGGPVDCEAIGVLADAGTCVPNWRVANSGSVTLSIP